MVTRTRSQLLFDKGGGDGFGSNPTMFYQNFISGEQTCIDTPSVSDCQPLIINKDQYSGGRITTHKPLSSAGWHGDEYSCHFVALRDGYGRSHISVPDRKPDGAYATSLRARTNPARPGVDLGINVLDMEHIPRGLQEEARELSKLARNLKFGSNKFLEYQFLIAPFVGDIIKLTDFTNSVQKRVNELNRLTSTRGLRRTIDLDYFQRKEDVLSTVVNSFGTFVRADLHKRTELRIRGHARWTGGDNLRSGPDREIDARSAILGLTFDPATAWNLIPWSWFDDWFLNIGEFLIGKRNMFGTSMSVCAIMANSSTRLVSDNHQTDPDVTMTPISVSSITKTRALVPPSIEAEFPILSGSQLGILASIGVLDRVGRH